MPPSKSASQRNTLEQIDELRRKMQLFEGERKAYYEKAEFKMTENKEKISELRSDNNQLRKQKAQKLSADEHVVSKGLEDNPEERTALRNKPGTVAVTIMDEKIGDRVNALNTAKYRTKQKEARLHDLQMQYKVLSGKDASESDRGGSNNSSGARAASGSSDAGGRRTGGSDPSGDDLTEEEKKEKDEGQKQRDLENRLDKSSLKCREAEHIQKTYLQIKMKLEDEHKSFENILDDMEQDIVRMKQQLKELKVMNNDAVIVRDEAKTDLMKLEKKIYADRRARDIEMQSVKREADEKRQQQEQFQRRIAARGSLAQDDLTQEQRMAIGGIRDEDQEKIHTHEQAFHRIKEATGVSDTQEVVLRFENQGDTQRHLEQLKTENEREIARLTDERDRSRDEYAEMKYTGEAKLSSGQRLLEEYEEHVKAEEVRRNEAQERLERASKILVDVKTGVEHLTEKLKVFKAAPSELQKTKLSPTSNEYVLDQLCICEEKLMKLMEQLNMSSDETDEAVRQMELDELHATIDIKLPTYNTRVKLPAVSKDIISYDDEDASGEDEEVLTRQGLKKQSQQIIETKTKRRPGKRKKKGTK